MRTRVLAVVAICVIAVVSTTGFGGPVGNTTVAVPEVRGAMHLALDKSSPEADQTVDGVDRISLWFTQSPQISGTSIRLVPTGGEPLDLGDAKMSESDDKLILLEVSETLAAGSYRVYWRAMAQDGHTVRGDFGFQVQATR